MLTYTSVTDFTKCLESADINSCSWYLEQLKAVSISSWLPSIHRQLIRQFFSARQRLPGTKRPTLLCASTVNQDLSV